MGKISARELVFINRTAFLLFPVMHPQLDPRIYQLTHSQNKIMGVLLQKGSVQIFQKNSERYSED